MSFGPPHLPAGGPLFKDEKRQKSLAVLVPDRLAKPQKPKRKKLALMLVALQQYCPITVAAHEKLMGRPLKQFFFFNGFCASANRAPTPPKAAA
ncbi:MAG: hypothetical protein AB8H12_12545 [Lewinella sp.]